MRVLRQRLLAAGFTLLAGVGCAQDQSGRAGRPSTTPATPAAAPQARAPDRQARATPDALVARRVVLGRSVEHRPIVAYQVGDPDNSRRTLVVGCIHGNESAGIALARRLIAAGPTAEADLWIVPDLNPDGVRAHRRGNAHGVDLNRNFPYRWRSIGAPGDLHYAGPHALSEPETRVAAALVRRLRPTVGVWYHQALAVVDDSQGPRGIERRYAQDTGLPLRSLPDYPGSGVGYEDHLLAGSAFVVELPGGALSHVATRRHVRAILHLARG